MKFRRRLLVQPRFQTWFLFRFLAYNVTLVGLLGVGIYSWVRIVANTIFRLLGLISDPALQLVRMNIRMGWWFFVGFTLALIGLAILGSFIFSKRIAGPLFAITRHLRKCAERGRLEKIHLRKGDLFTELTDQFNLVVDSISGKESKTSNDIVLKPFGNKEPERHLKTPVDQKRTRSRA